MFEVLFAIFLALSCPVQHQSNDNNDSGQVTTLDTGGENGTIPPPPPPPTKPIGTLG